MEYGRKMFKLGMLFMAGLFFAARAAHWFITPASQTSSDAWTAAVAAQAVVGLALAGFALLRYRRQLSADAA
jgi:nitrate reductase gamma subunit